MPRTADSRVMCGIVKRWLQQLKDDVEEPLKAVFRFKNTIVGSIDQIYCNLFASSSQIVDGFPSCQVIYLTIKFATFKFAATW